MAFDDKIPTELRAIKKKTGLSARQMADLIDRTPATIWNYLMGRKPIQADHMDFFREWASEDEPAA